MEKIYLWGTLFFFGLGMIAFLLFMYVGKLYKFKGTKLRTRMNYSLGFSLFLTLFFTLFFLWQTDDKMHVIGKSLLLSAVLCVPSCFYSKRSIEKRIEGTTIFYKSKQYSRNLLSSVPISILLMIFFIYFGKKIFEAAWPILGLSFTLFTTTVFLWFYVARLEKKLGSLILEDQK